MDINSISNILKVVPYITLMAGIIIVVVGIIKKFRVSRIVKYGVTAALVTVVLFVLSNVSVNQTVQLSDYIKKAHPASISDITYGQAIDYCCKDIEWSYSRENDDPPYGYTVQMDAKCKEDDSDIILQFFYKGDFKITDIKEDDTFIVSWAGKDKDAEITTAEMGQIVFEMFQKYGEANDIAVDETMMDGILEGISTGEAGEDDTDSEEESETETSETESLESEEDYLLFVKNGYPLKYPSITYEQAFSEFFGNPQWEYFRSEKGTDVIEFTGTCNYEEQEVEANLQFILNLEEGTFRQGAMSFNNNPQEDEITTRTISEAFKQYARSHGIMTYDMYK